MAAATLSADAEVGGILKRCFRRDSLGLSRANQPQGGPTQELRSTGEHYPSEVDLWIEAESFLLAISLLLVIAIILFDGMT